VPRLVHEEGTVVDALVQGRTSTFPHRAGLRRYAKAAARIHPVSALLRPISAAQRTRGRRDLFRPARGEQQLVELVPERGGPGDGERDPPARHRDAAHVPSNLALRPANPEFRWSFFGVTRNYLSTSYQAFVKLLAVTGRPALLVEACRSPAMRCSSGCAQLTRGLTLLFAVAGGPAVGNLHLGRRRSGRRT
jgi:hypothetical protein